MANTLPDRAGGWGAHSTHRIHCALYPRARSAAGARIRSSRWQRQHTPIKALSLWEILKREIDLVCPSVNGLPSFWILDPPLHLPDSLEKVGCFLDDGEPIKTVAKDAEKNRRRELEQGYNNLSDRREQRVQSVKHIAAAYFEQYKLRHRSVTFAEYAIGHVVRLLGNQMQVDVSDETVAQYQSTRLKEGASPKSINEEVGFLLRLLKERGDAIRLKMRREHTLKLRTG